MKAINQQPGVNLTHKQLALEFSSQRTESLKELTIQELKSLEDRLKAMAPQKKQDETLDRTRKAIISQFLSMGRSVQDAKNWAEKYGVKGKKKKFNDYTGQELYLLLQNAKKVKVGIEKSVDKRLNNRPDYLIVDDIGN